MFFRSAAECEALAKGYELIVDPKENTVGRNPPFPHQIGISFVDQRDRSYALANLVAAWLGDFETCVLTVTEFGIWPSNENLHLYYALRRAFGDKRQLTEAPGHVFLKHERTELVTFIDLAIQFGWGCVVFKYPQTACMTISHDEWMSLSSDAAVDRVAIEAEDFGLKVIGREGTTSH